MMDRLAEARLARLERLADRHPGRFCWAHLATIAIYGPRFEGTRCLQAAEEGASDCQADATTHGGCWCGYFPLDVALAQALQANAESVPALVAEVRRLTEALEDIATGEACFGGCDKGCGHAARAVLEGRQWP